MDDDGRIGLWRVGDGYASPWVVISATDFLFRAHERGYVVPEKARAALKARLIVEANGNSRTDLKERAYASLLLVRQGAGDIGALRYMHDNSNYNQLAMGFLGASLSLMGDKGRAASAMRQSLDRGDSRYDNKDYYASALRDYAILLAAAAEGGMIDYLPPLLEKIQRYTSLAKDMNTQEKAWLLMAAQAMRKGGGITLAVDNVALAGKSVASSRTVVPTEAQQTKGFTVANRSGRDIWRTLTLHGVPVKEPPPLSNGVTLEKTLHRLDGGKIETARLLQNDRIVVVLKGEVTDSDNHPLVLVDMLPAGLEIESFVLSDKEFAWLGKPVKVRVREKRDDRVVIAFDRYPGHGEYDPDEREREDGKSFTVAYVARAVTLGDFILPGGQVEDMYRPYHPSIFLTERNRV
jgi:uncharacterized protein YfaS (alpha-2-macroglobulin family)